MLAQQMNPGVACRKLVGASMEGMNIAMSIRVDKGVTFSAIDEAFVVYKKNQFQLSYQITVSSPIRCVASHSNIALLVTT